MKHFCLRIFILAAIFFAGCICPALAQAQNSEMSDASSYNGSSLGLFSSSTSDQQTVSESDPLNDGTALFSAGPPPGTGGNPIGGETPIGHGFPFLMGIGFFYLLYIGMFNFIKKKKMNKSIIAFVVLLAVSVTQSFGQPGVKVPNGANLIYFQDFGGNSPDSLLVCKDSLQVIAPGATTSLIFQNVRQGPANNGDFGAYTLTKNLAGTAGTGTNQQNIYGVWWGNGQTQANVTESNSICDHTSQSNTNASAKTGYMMAINAAKASDVFFRYPINDLCPNTKLYVSFWAANLLYNKTSSPPQDDPCFTVEIQAPDSTVLASYDSIVPKYYPKSTYTTLPAPDYGWNNYVLEFQNTKYPTIYVVFINQRASTNGNDLALDDIGVYKITPDITPASISSPNFYYCLGSPMDMEASYLDSTNVFEGNARFAWLYSAKGDFTDSLVVSKDSICRWPAQEGKYKVIIGADGNFTYTDPDSTHLTYNHCSSVSPEVTVNLIPPSTVLYWNGSENEDWNDYRNWTDDGAPAQFAPNSCVDVEIPGNKTVFPSLDFTATKDSFACNNIRFHYGGLIGQPQELIYKKAFVQYNFGNNTSDPYSATAMDRDSRWYALAAPLQKMASGDFGFCGYPTVWQERFSSTVQSDGYQDLGVGVYGAWYVPENINSWDLSTQYNAITLWVQQDSPNLNTGLDATSRALKGILEVPFYQNAIDSVYHRGIYRSDDNNTSYFQYYYSDQPQLGYPLIDPAVKTPGLINRGSNNEAYRFIFDGPSFSSGGSKGVYKMDIPTPAASASGMIMVGNPFMSDLDFTQFAADNDISGYYTYNGDNFSTYSHYTSGNLYIAPLQAFFIEPATAATTLTFNANTEAVVAPAAYIPALRASTADSGAKADVMFITAANTKGSSRVTLSLQDLNAKNLPLLLMKGYDSIPGIYALDAAGQRNAIQFEGGYVDSIPLGVYSSDSADPITLTVSEKDKLSVSYLKLIDKYQNKTIDLMTTNTYAYTNVPNMPDRFLLLMKYNQTTTGISTPVSTRPVAVSVSNNTLYVSSGVSIEDVSVITLQGITVAKDSNIGKPTYAKSLELPAGLYLVSVKVKTGQTSVAKVVIR